MLSAGLKLKTGPGHKHRNGGRHKELARRSRVHYPSGDVHSDPSDVAVSQLHFASV